MRIAAHNGARAYGGGEKWAVLLLKGLQARGHDTHLYCGHEAVAERARAEGVEATRAHLGGPLMLPAAAAFAGKLRSWRADALLITTFKKVWLGSMAARMAGVPRVVSRVGLETDLPDRHWTYGVAYRRWVDATLVNADRIRVAFIERLRDVDPSRVATVYDGVEIEDGGWDPNDVRRELGLPLDSPIVGAVARLSAQKRLDRLLEALTFLPRAHLVLAGEGELEAALRGQAASLGIADRVHFLGYRTDVARVLASFDVFAVTSDKEGMANAMLEAMAAGVPVVSTRVSGATEALEWDAEGRAPGLIVSADPRAISEAIQGILDVMAVRLSMSVEGRRRVGQRFSYAAMLDAWEGVLAGDDAERWHRGPSSIRPQPKARSTIR